MAIAPDKAISETLPTPATHQEFDWQNCWYPIAFTEDLPKDKPYRFSLYNEPLVLFINQEGKLGCLTDRCSHRAARLSDGQIIDGRIECLYHGWQFGIDGQCLHIPQLPQDAKIPANACVKSLPVVERQGMIWMWAGQEQPIEELIPTIPALDKAGVFCTDYIRDLPYDQTYFIENIIDPAHVYISHDGFLGKRENAQPLEIEVVDNSIEGIRSRWRGIRQANQAWVSIDFIAPNLILYKFGSEEQGRFRGTVLYSLPLSKDKCRIFLRNYGNFFPWQVKLMPRWFDHIMIRNIILEGDLQIVVEQKRQIERLGKSLKEIYLPLKTSDTLVVEYRKWLDKFGQGLPFYQGYSSEKNFHSDELQENSLTLDRLSQHTQICSSCNQAYQVTNSSKQIL